MNNQKYIIAHPYYPNRALVYLSGSTREHDRFAVPTQDAPALLRTELTARTWANLTGGVVVTEEEFSERLRTAIGGD
jgi:hypothetical protein